MAADSVSIRVPVEVWTEGKTDWKILKRAKELLGIRLDIDFHQYNDNMGDDKLLKTLKTFSEHPNTTPMVFIFDRDNKEITSQVDGGNEQFKDWGNNVFSFAIPLPDYRRDREGISIEMYFKDEELCRPATGGRRLFLSSEFRERSGKHKDEPTIHYAHAGALKGMTNVERTKIIDQDVFDAKGNNIALTKADFAELVCSGIYPFDSLDFGEFRQIFSIIAKIAKQSEKYQNILFPDTIPFLESVRGMDSGKQFLALFQAISHLTRLALQLFIAVTIRYYEHKIVNEPSDGKKRYSEIKRIISDSFREPSLIVLHKLAEKCYFIIDAKAPDALSEMKNCFDISFRLGSIGNFWDDLETLIPPEFGTAKLVNKSDLHKDLFKHVLKMVAEYGSKSSEVIEQGLSEAQDNPSISIEHWFNAYKSLLAYLTPIYSNPVVFRTIRYFDPDSGKDVVDIRKYYLDRIETDTEYLARTDDEYELKASEILLSETKSVRIYPLLFVRNDALYLYVRTFPGGYEYYSFKNNNYFREANKRKFSYSMFKISNQQELFWTDVLPRENEISGIRANIPEQDSGIFVGRRRKLTQIKKEVIEIVNENGIVYGPGGIGKTALMIHLCKELYGEKDKDNVSFNNIIWVSAKDNLYNYLNNTIDTKDPQVKSLDAILMAILRFFEFENIHEYSFADRKELTLMLLEEKKVLLIIDNLESIPQNEQQKIISFFGTDVKVRLKKRPTNFKVIATSRQHVPLGFRPVELSGLEFMDAKKLISNIHARYKSSKPDLTDSQKKTMYQVTVGVPLLMKHCLARVYEYNEPFDGVIRSLPEYSNTIVQFSFSEIIERLRGETVGLSILLLLEIVDRPLMIRQIADILEINEYEIENKVPLLANFECVKRVNLDNQEKYALNDEIRLLSKSLLRKHKDLTQDIREKYFKNYTIDKQLDYSVEEKKIIQIFDDYLRDSQYSIAEDFIKGEIKRNPNSVILNYYYAQYLKNQRKEPDKAITILENLRELTHNHPFILKSLFSCYASASVPNYEQADILVSQIRANMGGSLDDDLSLLLEIGWFYIHWSSSLKWSKGIDHFEERRRQEQYKFLADKALEILKPMEMQIAQQRVPKELTDTQKSEVYYLLAQGHYNRWEYDLALRFIAKAIEYADTVSNNTWPQECRGFQKRITSTKSFWDKNPWIDRRK